jgi:hypothetical protein
MLKLQRQHDDPSRGVSAADYSEDAIADPKVLAFIPPIKIAVGPEIESRGPSFHIHTRNPPPSRQSGEPGIEKISSGNSMLRIVASPFEKTEL